MEPRIGDCEIRISRLEDNNAEHERAIEKLMENEDDYPVDKTLVCTGIAPSPSENLITKAQDLVRDDLELENTRVTRAMRMRSHNDKPGLVKIVLPTVQDKVAALRNKRKLSENGYRRVFVRSSQSPTDRVMQHNIQTLLAELPNGNQFRVTAHGKLVNMSCTLPRKPDFSEPLTSKAY